MAAGSAEGLIAVWETSTCKLVYEEAVCNSLISGLTFSADNETLIATDTYGHLIKVEGIGSVSVEPAEAPKKVADKVFGKITDLEDEESRDSTKKSEQSEDDAFDDGMDDLFSGNIDDNQDEEDDNEFSITKIKAEVGFIDDEYVGPSKAMKKGVNPIDDDDDDDIMETDRNNEDQGRKVIEKKIFIDKPLPFTEPQRPFQPGATPISREHRFMVRKSISSC